MPSPCHCQAAIVALERDLVATRESIVVKENLLRERLAGVATEIERRLEHLNNSGARLDRTLAATVSQDVFSIHLGKLEHEFERLWVEIRDLKLRHEREEGRAESAAKLWAAAISFAVAVLTTVVAGLLFRYL